MTNQRLVIAEHHLSDRHSVIPGSCLRQIAREMSSVSNRRFVILVVDDEEGIRTLIGDQLEEEGYDVVLASSGDHAMEVLGAIQHVDLIVTDVRMPGRRNGFDVIEQALAADPNLRTIVMSGYSDELGKRAGIADRFLLKPFTMSIIAKEVQSLLAA